MGTLALPWFDGSPQLLTI